MPEFTNFTFDSEKWIGPTTFGGRIWSSTSPTSILTPSNNYQYVYYLNPNGGMSDWFWAGNGTDLTTSESNRCRWQAQ